jgi:NADP-dependent 3-hydroxy acid dehydrogenase YdfG
MAKALVTEGVDIALAARRRERLDDLAEIIAADYDVDTLVIPTDVTDADQVSDMVEETVDGPGMLDLVVANAGVFDPTPVKEITVEALRRMNAVNVDGSFLTAKYAVPYLRETEGILLFVASAAGEYPRP